MSTTASPPERALSSAAGLPAVLAGECASPGRHLMVAVTVDPAAAGALRESVAGVLEGDGLWCGPAAASRRCRTALLRLVTMGGVSAEVVDAADYDDPGEARAECLLAVAGLAEDAGVNRVVLARDDTRAAGDSSWSSTLAHRAGVSPTLRCVHADATAEPLTVLAELLVRCWSEGGDTRRRVAGVLRAVHRV